MAKIPEEVKDFVDQGHLAYVSTCSKDGKPHVVPKGSIAILDDDHLIFADLYSGQTQKNIEENPRISVAIVNPPAYRGYEFTGTAEIVARGKEFDELAAKVERGQMTYHRAKHAVKVTVDEVLELKP